MKNDFFFNNTTLCLDLRENIKFIEIKSIKLFTITEVLLFLYVKLAVYKA